jgi:iron-sulfur cluster assembly protein
MITITENASRALLQSLKEDGKTTETHRLRVGVESGGCSGLQYFMEFFDKNENFEGDKVIETNVIDVVVDKLSVLYIAGTELDYSSGLNGKGFEWKNPNAQRTCGCGESFSL